MAELRYVAWLDDDGVLCATGPPSAGVYFHYLHHAYYDCNYGDTVVPLDWLFGSFIDAPPGSKKGATARGSRATTANEASQPVAAGVFDAEGAVRIQEDTIPKQLRFSSPGRKSTVVEGKRKHKSPARFVQQ